MGEKWTIEQKTVEKILGYREDKNGSEYHPELMIKFKEEKKPTWQLLEVFLCKDSTADGVVIDYLSKEFRGQKALCKELDDDGNIRWSIANPSDVAKLVEDGEWSLVDNLHDTLSKPETSSEENDYPESVCELPGNENVDVSDQSATSSSFVDGSCNLIEEAKQNGMDLETYRMWISYDEIVGYRKIDGRDSFAVHWVIKPSDTPSWLFMEELRLNNAVNRDYIQSFIQDEFQGEKSVKFKKDAEGNFRGYVSDM